MTTRRIVLGLSLAIQCAACRTPAGPMEAIEDYQHALHARSVSKIVAMTSTIAMSERETLASWLARHPDAMATEFDRLSSHSPRLQSVQVEWSDGSLMRLLPSGGGWVIEDGSISMHMHPDPVSALHAFFNAIRARRWDVVQELVPRSVTRDRSQKRWIEAILGQQSRIERAETELRRYAKASAIVDGAEARVHYGSGLVAKLALEEGSWRVWDVE